MIYALQFPAGFEKWIEVKIGQLPKLKVIKVESGLILIDSTESEESKLKQLGWFSSIELVFIYGSYKDIDQLINSIKLNDLSDLSLSAKTFQLRTFVNNQPAKIDDITRSKLLNLISNKYRIKYSAHRPDMVFSIKLRQSGFGYFGVSLSSDHNKYQKGELRLAAASLLTSLADLPGDPLILEAFGGYGGLTRALIKLNPKSLKVIEKDKDLAKMLRSRLGKTTIVINDDAVNYLNENQDAYDLIIADPPWGNYSKIEDDLYLNFLLAAKLKLTDNGNIVIISSDKLKLEQAVSKSGLNLNLSLDVLISGKKARVYSLSND